MILFAHIWNWMPGVRIEAKLSNGKGSSAEKGAGGPFKMCAPLRRIESIGCFAYFSNFMVQY